MLSVGTKKTIDKFRPTLDTLREKNEEVYAKQKTTNQSLAELKDSYDEFIREHRMAKKNKKPTRQDLDTINKKFFASLTSINRNSNPVVKKITSKFYEVLTNKTLKQELFNKFNEYIQKFESVPLEESINFFNLLPEGGFVANMLCQDTTLRLSDALRYCMTTPKQFQPKIEREIQRLKSNGFDVLNELDRIILNSILTKVLDEIDIQPNIDTQPNIDYDSAFLDSDYLLQVLNYLIGKNTAEEASAQLLEYDSIRTTASDEPTQTEYLSSRDYWERQAVAAKPTQVTDEQRQELMAKYPTKFPPHHVNNKALLKQYLTSESNASLIYTKLSQPIRIDNRHVTLTISTSNDGYLIADLVKKEKTGENKQKLNIKQLKNIKTSNGEPLFALMDEDQDVQLLVGGTFINGQFKATMMRDTAHAQYHLLSRIPETVPL